MTRLTHMGAIAVLIAGFFAIAYLHASSVGTTAAKRVQCLNAALHQRQRLIDAEFRTEYAKVAGQVKGLKQLNTAPRAGVAQFIRASEHYLVVIKRQNDYSQSHPLGNC